MSTTQQPARGAARIGRRIGIAVFWLMAVFIVAASSRSVLGEIYGRQDAGDATAQQQAACASALRTLETSLRTQAALALRERHDAAHIAQWLSAWDHEYETVDACGPLEEARLSLGDLRARMATLLQQHARRSAPLNERIRRALERFDAQQPPRPSEET
jgi:hypothetical protein